MPVHPVVVETFQSWPTLPPLLWNHHLVLSYMKTSGWIFVHPRSFDVNASNKCNLGQQVVPAHHLNSHHAVSLLVIAASRVITGLDVRVRMSVAKSCVHIPEECSWGVIYHFSLVLHIPDVTALEADIRKATPMTLGQLQLQQQQKKGLDSNPLLQLRPAKTFCFTQKHRNTTADEDKEASTKHTKESGEEHNEP